MRVCFIALTLLSTSCLFAQKIEMFGGANRNTFYDRDENTPHTSSSYTSDYGVTAGIGLDSIKVDWLLLRFTLQYDEYYGKVEASNGGLGGSYTYDIAAQKSVVSLGAFPVNLRFFDRVDVNVGLIASRLVHESFSGKEYGWGMDSLLRAYSFDREATVKSSKTYFGLQARISYDFKLTESICVSPQYMCYLGTSKEFTEFPRNTKSMRHYLCVGIKKNLN